MLCVGSNCGDCATILTLFIFHKTAKTVHAWIHLASTAIEDNSKFWIGSLCLASSDREGEVFGARDMLRPWVIGFQSIQFAAKMKIIITDQQMNRIKKAIKQQQQQQQWRRQQRCVWHRVVGKAACVWHRVVYKTILVSGSNLHTHQIGQSKYLLSRKNCTRKFLFKTRVTAYS